MSCLLFTCNFSFSSKHEKMYQWLQLNGCIAAWTCREKALWTEQLFLSDFNGIMIQCIRSNRTSTLLLVCWNGPLSPNSEKHVSESSTTFWITSQAGLKKTLIDINTLTYNYMYNSAIIVPIELMFVYILVICACIPILM